jgi:hypothetical protein
MKRDWVLLRHGVHDVKPQVELQSRRERAKRGEWKLKVQRETRLIDSNITLNILKPSPQTMNLDLGGMIEGTRTPRTSLRQCCLLERRELNETWSVVEMPL